MPTGPYPTDPPPTFLGLPDDFYDLSEADQDKVIEQMADIMWREQIEPLKKAEAARRRARAAGKKAAKKPIRFVLPKNASDSDIQQVVNRIRAEAGLEPEPER